KDGATAIHPANKAAKDAAAANAAFETAKKNALGEEEAVKAIVAGQAERRNWLELFRFVNTCVPQPNGDNLSPEARETYFDKASTGDTGAMSGEQAYLRYKARLTRGNQPKTGADEKENKDENLYAGSDDLVQFHIH